jgi:anti-repressor protein
MEQLIKITTNEKNEQVVSARELYQGLELSMPHWSKWSLRNIENNRFVIEGQDWEGFTQEVNGNPVKDFAITIDFAKRIAMMAKTEKGEMFRTYFLECEKIAQSKQSVKLPTTYLEALKELVVKEEQIILLQEKNEKLQFRSDFVDVCFDTNSLFSMEEASKILKLPYGRNKMMEKLRNHGVLLSSNTPKQKYISNGYFKVVETLIQNGEFKKLVSTTYVSQKGIGFIHKLLIEKQ